MNHGSHQAPICQDDQDRQMRLPETEGKALQRERERVLALVLMAGTLIAT